jgi:hypothetical protein
MRFARFVAMLACAVPLACLAVAARSEPAHPGGGGGHFSGHGGWMGHPGWSGDIHHFDHGYWRGGHWWHGPYGGRDGWWWIVGPDWYWYSAPVYPFPDPFTPPGMAPGYWYWCDAYQQYYPYVGACPVPWRPVTPQ